jgi:LysM repeat protein
MRWTERIPGDPPRRARRAPVAIAVALLLGAATSSCRHAPPPASSPPRASGSLAAYAVQPGDTIEQIAAWHGVRAAEIERLNTLGPQEPLASGRTLVVPFQPLATYTVKPGDTLGTLADAFGVEVVALAHLNAIADPRRLAAGTLLRIPADAQRTETPIATRAPRRPPDAAASAPATNETDGALAAAHAAFDGAEFEAAIAWADRAQQYASSRDPVDRARLARAHLVRGMAEVALGRDDAARTSFGHALELDRSIDLDPNETSPKVLSLFREVRGR